MACKGLIDLTALLARVLQFYKKVGTRVLLVFHPNLAAVLLHQLLGDEHTQLRTCLPI
jgi:hypothetical protein